MRAEWHSAAQTALEPHREAVPQRLECSIASAQRRSTPRRRRRRNFHQDRASNILHHPTAQRSIGPVSGGLLPENPVPES
jgi:hypothetical protein